MRYPGIVLVGCMTVLFLTACAQQSSAPFEERLENGVRVRAYTQPIPPVVNPYTVGDPITYGSGQSEETYLLSSAGFAGRLPDGVVLVTDLREGCLHRFAPDGRWLGSFGRPGPGPQEFGRFPQPVVVGDEILVWVPANQRLLRFESGGTFLEGRHCEVRIGSAPVPVSGTAGSEYITLYSSLMMPYTGVETATVRYGVFQVNTELTRSDTLLYREGQGEGFWIGQGFNLQPLQPLFPPWAVAPDRPLALGWTDRYRIDFIPLQGQDSLAVELPLEGPLVTDEEKETEIARYRRRGNEETARRHLEFPDRKAAIRWMVWAGDGRLWVEDHTPVPGEEEGRHYNLFTAAGEWVASQVLPDRPAAVMGDGFYRNEENEAGEPVIRFYPFERTVRER